MLVLVRFLACVYDFIPFFALSVEEKKERVRRHLRGGGEEKGETTKKNYISRTLS